MRITAPLFSRRLLFYGSDSFSVTCLNALLQRQDLYSSIDVVCSDATIAKGTHHLTTSPVHAPPSIKSGKKRRRSKRKMRGSELRHFAMANSTSIKNIYNAPPFHPNDFMEESSQGDYDLAIVASFGYFIPADVLAKFPEGGINVHPSLLPKYRGASPIQHALLNGDKKTGVSIIEVHPRKFDAGDILRQDELGERIDTDSMMFSNLHEKLAKLGGNALVNVLANLSDIRNNISIEKEGASPMSSGVTKGNRIDAPKIVRADATINWERFDNLNIYHRWRALSETWGIHTYLKRKRVVTGVQLHKLRLPSKEEMAYAVSEIWGGDAKRPEYGDCKYDKGLTKALWIACRSPENHDDISSGNNGGGIDDLPCFILCEQLKVAGRPKEVQASDFVNGIRLEPNETLTFQSEGDIEGDTQNSI
eukprot:g1079.t1